MMRTYITSLFILTLASTFPAAGKSMPADAVFSQSTVALERNDSTTEGGFLISTNTVIKFDKDSVVLSDGRYDFKVSLDEFAGINHNQNIISDFSVKVLCDNERAYPIPGCLVTLQNERTQDYYAITQRTDEEGVAHFTDMPAGIYNAYLSDGGIRMFEFAETRIAHSYRDQGMGEMHEIVLLPSDLEYNVTENPEGKFNVEVVWGMNNGPLNDGPFRDYLFSLFLDGYYIGDTSETNYFIENLQPGEYQLTITALSWYGNETTGSFTTRIVIEDPNPMETEIILASNNNQ